MDQDIANNDGYINIDREPLRERSNISSTIFSKEAFTHSSISSIPYVDRMEIQKNNSL